MHLSGWKLVVVAVAVSLIAACGGGDDGASPDGATTTGGTAIAAQLASYEIVAGHDQRVLVGVLSESSPGLGMSFGTVQLAFVYLGTKEAPLDDPRPGPTATATFRPVPGQHVDPDSAGPRLVKPSEGVGVYGADRVRFDVAGNWGVLVTAELDGVEVSARAAFEVLSEPRVPFPGQPAPRTDNPIAGAAGVPSAAIDSRARDGASVPDPELHSTSIADAIEAGKPVMVVVSTPTYCQSRFCGPITDSVSALAKRFGDRMAFVHIEVWEDFEAKKLTAAAREWIVPKSGGNAAEPWTFVVGDDGNITDRFDNVATDAELESAAQRVLG